MKRFTRPSKITTNIICFDLETGNRSVDKAEPLSFAGIVIDINTLQPKENGIFQCLIKPTNWDNVEQEALDVNKLTRQEIEEKGIEQDEFMRQLVDFLRKFQRSSKRWDCLIPAGFNITNYDNIIMNRLAIQHGYFDKTGPTLFHPLQSFDLLLIMTLWHFSNNELESYSLENIRKYFGLSAEGAHTALKDTQDVVDILTRMLKFYKQLAPKHIPKMKNCFANQGDTID